MTRWQVQTMQGWSGCPSVTQEAGSLVAGEPFAQCLPTEATVLARGLGRSYGDVALNSRGRLWQTERMKRVLQFDRETGVVRAEAGLSLAELLEVTVPAGRLPPVLPGTSWVSLGGAVANDIHGKNHPDAGSFGCHVRRLGLWRSDGGVVACSPAVHPELFRATIGGLGLTGLILWVELATIPLVSDRLVCDVQTVATFDDLLRRLCAGDHGAFRVAWLDGSASARDFGRGLVMRADFCSQPNRLTWSPSRGHLLAGFPVPKLWASDRGTRLLNRLYRWRWWLDRRRRRHFSEFLFPLESWLDMRRLYRDDQVFVQFQCVVPPENAPALAALVLQARQKGHMPRLVTLKVFGGRPAPGLLSFPMAGVTLALDLPNFGADTVRLYRTMAAMVAAWGGRLYPAKDCFAQGKGFFDTQPHFEAFCGLVDPRFGSDLWSRLQQAAPEGAGLEPV